VKKGLFQPHYWLSWGYILLVVAVTGLVMLLAAPMPNDDYFYYQKFIEMLAGGTLDLSIPGFHGMNILSVPWYWLTESPMTQIHMQMEAGILLPLFAFVAARELFRSQEGGDGVWEGILFASIIALMPFLSFSALRGWMVAIYNLLFFLTIIGAVRGRWWTCVPWAFAITSLPFAVALGPLILAVWPKGKGGRFSCYTTIALGLGLSALYVIIQLFQTGGINVGVHQEQTVLSIWQGPKRMFLNFMHGVQILFSIHNYYFVEPARTGHGNMLQTTPILTMLGLFTLFSPRAHFRNRLFPLALGLGAIIGIGLNVMLDHMDHFYMETGVFFLILAALPLLKKHPLWLPVVLLTLHFQWFYFHLNHGEVFQLGWWFFLIPAAVDIAFLLYCIANYKKIWSGIRSITLLSWRLILCKNVH